MKRVILMLLGFCGISAFAADFTYLDTVGDHKWSNAANWLGGQKPTEGGVVHFSNVVQNVQMICNVDEVPPTLSSIRFEGVNGIDNVVLSGEKLTLSGTWTWAGDSSNHLNYDKFVAAVLCYGSGATISNDLEFTHAASTGMITARKDLVVHGDISVPTATKFSYHAGLNEDSVLGHGYPNASPRICCYGAFVAPQADLIGAQYPCSEIYFYGKTKAVSVTDGTWVNAKFVAAGEEFSAGMVKLSWSSWMTTLFSGNLSSNFVFSPALDNSSNDGSYLNLHGTDQTIDRIEGAVTAGKENVTQGAIRSWSATSVSESGASIPATLTLRGTKSATSIVRLADAVSMVWDPTDEKYVQTLTGRIHPTTGSLTVNRGAIRLEGATQFTAVSRVVVKSGAMFDVATSEGTTVFLGSPVFRVAGTLSVGADVDFGTSSTIWIDGGKILLPANGVLTIKALLLDGVPQEAKTYRASECDWFEGEGATVVVTSVGRGNFWASSDSGAWDDVTKWTPNGVPASDAVISANAKDITVTVGSDAEVSGLKIENVRHTTTLSVQKQLSVKVPLLDLGQGSVVDVPTGGTLPITGEYTDVKDEVRVSIHDGGLLRIDGGSVSAVSFKGEWDVLSGGEVAIKDGLFEIAPCGYGESSEWKIKSNGFRVLEGGSLNVSGGEFRIGGYGNSVYSDFLTLYGGSAVFSGFAKLGLGVSFAVTPACMFGSGVACFKDNSECSRAIGAPDGKYMSMIVRSTLAGVPALVRFTDHSSLSGITSLNIGNSDSMGTARVEMLSDAETTCLGERVIVGNVKGRGELKIDDGKVAVKLTASASACGLFVGSGTDSSAVAFNSEGLLDVSGGELNISAPVYLPSGLQGLIIGDGTHIFASKVGQNECRGTMKLSGNGKILATPMIMVGGGEGIGLVEQSGGELIMSASSRSDYRNAFVGFGGGRGTWKMTGGSVTLPNDLYIGGLSTNNVGYIGSTQNHNFFPGGEKHDSVGCFTASDGVLSVGGGIIIGADGNGSFAFGPSANISVGEDMVLSNRISSALAIKLGENGLTPMSISGKLKIAEGSKIKVDFSEYDMKASVKSSIKLIAYGGVEGRFREEDVELNPGENEKGEYSLVCRPNGLYLRQQRGMILLFR